MKLRYLLTLALIPFFLSSCLEITEQMRLHNDESGQFTFTIDLHNAQPFLDFAKKFSNDEDAQEEIDIEMNDAAKRIRNIAGITSVKKIKSKDGLLAGVTFEFKNIASLNKALNQLKDNDEHKNYFDYSQGKLKRINTMGSNIKEDLEDKDFDLDISINGKTIHTALGEMVYRTEYSFDAPIKSVSNPSAEISDDRQSVTVAYFFMNKNRAANSLENLIQL